jgi:hypothetical protein
MSATRRKRSFSNGARIVLRARVAVAELRAAEAVVRQHAAVERQLPAALAADDRELRLVEELAAAEPGADLGPEVARAGDREARLVRARAGQDGAVAELQLDHVGVPGDAAAALFDRVDEPGEELATEEALRLDDGEEVLGHSYISSSSSAGS